METDSDFETECENLVNSFGILAVIDGDDDGNDDDDDPTVQTSNGGSAADSDFSSSSFSSAPALFSEITWAVHGSTGRSSNPQLEISATRSSNFEHCTDDDLLLMARDQWGSQYLQEQIITSMDSKILDKLFRMVLMFTFELMSDQYGRFVFGKFIESCEEPQLILITFIITMQDHLLLRASTDHFGSSSIKKLIRVVVSNSRSLMLHRRVMSALKRLFKFMMMTKLGSSVILQCLEPIYSHKNDMIYQAALEHCLYLACHKQGCISLNNFIDDMRRGGGGSRRRQILHLISMNAVSLSRDPCGNYVVQHVLKLEDPHLIETICSVLKGHYVDLSLMKCGSFVVQKCLQHQNTVHHVVEDFLNSDRIFQVASDKYGNYVIQTALAETMKPDTVDLHRRLVSELQQHLPALKMMKYGRGVCTMIGVPLPGALYL